MKTFKDPYQNKNIDRQPENQGVDPLFLRRWSPRSFRKEKISREVLDTLFEAARWSPSCFNEQPWLFLVSGNEEERELFLSLLVEKNQKWARSAPVLAFSFAKRRFSKNDKSNPTAPFDTGAAWMSLTLQARFLGLYTHGMAGIKKEEIYEKLQVPIEDYEVICGMAIGPMGSGEELPEEFHGMEKPNQRKPLDEVRVFGKFKRES